MLNRWTNAADLQRIGCPTFFLHADQDQLIDVQQSIQMHHMRKKLSLPSELYIQRSVEGMSRKDHNTFDFEDDVISPIQSFFRTFMILKEVEEEKTYSLDNEAISRAAFTPAMYTQYEMKKNTVADMCMYSLCPLVFPAEAFLACFGSLSTYLAISAGIVKPPEYRYRCRSERGLPHFKIEFRAPKRAAPAIRTVTEVTNPLSARNGTESIEGVRYDPLHRI